MSEGVMIAPKELMKTELDDADSYVDSMELPKIKYPDYADLFHKPDFLLIKSKKLIKR